MNFESYGQPCVAERSYFTVCVCVCVSVCVCVCVCVSDTDLNPQQPRKQARPTHNTTNTAPLRNSLERVKYIHPLLRSHTASRERVRERREVGTQMSYIGRGREEEGGEGGREGEGGEGGREREREGGTTIIDSWE